jgi:Tfp pilus assembly protein PilF
VAQASYIYNPTPEEKPPAAAETPAGGSDAEKALACFARGEIGRCLELLNEARRTNSEMAPAQVILAELYLGANQLDRARAALEQAAVDEPACPRTYVMLGRLALAEARVAEGEVLLEKAQTLAAASGYSEASRKALAAEASSGLAAIAERRADWPRAAACLGAWIDANPRDGQARVRLARARFRQGKRENTHEELQQARAVDPTLDPPGLIMARLCTEVGELKKAAEWVAYALTAAPRDARTHLEAAFWYLEQDQPDRAREHALTAAKLDGDSARIKEVRGLIAWHLKNHAEAEQLFQDLAIEAPGNVAASSMWALALAEQSSEAKRRRALQIAEMLVRAEPSSALALTALGRVYDRNGRTGDAEQTLRAALQSGSASSETAYYLARVLAARGSNDELGPLLKLALDAPGRFAFRRDAREWLAKVSR